MTFLAFLNNFTSKLKSRALNRSITPSSSSFSFFGSRSRKEGRFVDADSVSVLLRLWIQLDASHFLEHRNKPLLMIWLRNNRIGCILRRALSLSNAYDLQMRCDGLGCPRRRLRHTDKWWSSISRKSNHVTCCVFMLQSYVLKFLYSVRLFSTAAPNSCRFRFL